MNRRGYKDEASNTTQWLWNSELTYSFLKGKRGLLKFQVVDILQQRDFVNRWMNDTGQEKLGLGDWDVMRWLLLLIVLMIFPVRR